MNAIEITSLPRVPTERGSAFQPGHYTWHEGRARYVAFLARTVFGLTDGPVLDVGCGMGYFLRELVELGVPAAGFDIAEEAVQGSADRSDAPVTVHDATRPWPYPDRSFHAVTMFDVIEHLQGHDRALAEAHRVLVESGYLFVVTVNWSSVLRMVLGSRWGAFQDPEHVAYFDRTRLTRALVGSRFSVRELHTLFNLSVAGESSNFLLPLRRPGILVFVPELGDSIYAVGQKP